MQLERCGLTRQFGPILSTLKSGRLGRLFQKINHSQIAGFAFCSVPRWVRFCRHWLEPDCAASLPVFTVMHGQFVQLKVH